MEQESKKKRIPKGFHKDGTPWIEGKNVSKEEQEIKNQQAEMVNTTVGNFLSDITGTDATDLEYISPHTQHQILSQQVQLAAMFNKFNDCQKDVIRVIIEHPEIYIKGKHELARFSKHDYVSVWRYLKRPDVQQFLNAYFETNCDLPKFSVVQELIDEYKETPRGKYRLELLDRIMKVQGWDGHRGTQTFVFNNPAGSGQQIFFVPDTDE